MEGTPSDALINYVRAARTTANSLVGWPDAGRKADTGTAPHRRLSI